MIVCQSLPFCLPNSKKDTNFDEVNIADEAKFINLPAIDSIYENEKNSFSFIEALQLIKLIISGTTQTKAGLRKTFCHLQILLKTSKKSIFKMTGLLHSLLSQDLDRIERQLAKGNKPVLEDLRHIADILEDLIKLTIFDDIHTKNLHVPHNVFKTTVDRADSTGKFAVQYDNHANSACTNSSPTCFSGHVHM